MHYHSWLECIRGCRQRHAVFDVVYRCETCGGLLDVEHDITASRTAAPLRVDTAVRAPHPHNRVALRERCLGKEWVCPEIDNENVVSMYEGHTNCFWAERLGRELGIEDLWVKLCGNSHTGSFKDLGMTVLISIVRQMIANGQPIRAVVCASTGDTSAALASYAAAAGIPSGRAAPQRQGVDPSAPVSHCQWRSGPGPGHRFRRLYADRPPTHRGSDSYLANSMNAACAWRGRRP